MQIVSRTFIETSGKEKLPFNRKKPSTGPGSYEEADDWLGKEGEEGGQNKKKKELTHTTHACINMQIYWL